VGGGTKSYDCEKAWSSINHATLSASIYAEQDADQDRPSGLSLLFAPANPHMYNMYNAHTVHKYILYIQQIVTPISPPQPPTDTHGRICGEVL
jgi:hypothetical protein